MEDLVGDTSPHPPRNSGTAVGGYDDEIDLIVLCVFGETFCDPSDEEFRMKLCTFGLESIYHFLEVVFSRRLPGRIPLFQVLILIGNSP